MRLVRSELESWVGERTVGLPPPAIAVDLGAISRLSTLPGLNVIASLRAEELDPGCFPFYIDPVHLGVAELTPELKMERATRRLMDGLVDDHRLAGVVPGPISGGGEAAVLGRANTRTPSSIRLSNNEIVAVVGPGGRVTISVQETGIFGHTAVRPLRMDLAVRAASRWHPAASVVDSLAPYLDQDMEVFPEFGYYESSWLEHQEVVRPAFVFSVESAESVPTPYRTEVLVPATYGDAPTEGHPLDGL